MVKKQNIKAGKLESISNTLYNLGNHGIYVHEMNPTAIKTLTKVMKQIQGLSKSEQKDLSAFISAITKNR